MAHECEQCGMECYCDMDDTGGLPQPNDCPHLNGGCDDDWDDDEFSEEEITNENATNNR